MEMDSVKIILAFVLLSNSMIVKGDPATDCAVIKCYYPPGCVEIPAKGQCCPKCKRGKSCKYEVGNGSDKVKVNIQHGESIQIECNTCTCIDGVLACTEKACLPA
ncbi:kielin/chordin-like protein isoform X3 [Ruditapes philippinarum]|uniref:kielin/chordin-like protein isoform X3 n=1 Tax=Ruditapes philippinarum TaxID=129788 RepID=UPI00295B2F19|nr:kielin/chordin-like protein isoform X3 [Ruditapes philippinarum]